MVKATKRGRFGLLKDKVRDFIYGMAGHEMARVAVQNRASREHLFLLVTMGDLLGVPLVPPYYSRRLLPYLVPRLSPWKRRMLREKDLTDGVGELG